MKTARIILLSWLLTSAISQADPLIVWGNFNYGPSLANVPASATNIIALAAGDTHCLALKADGTVVAWGGGVRQTNVPPNLTNVVSIAAGSTHSLALKSDGTLAAWGSVFPSSVNITVPPAATNVVALALGPGAQHVLVLKADGTVMGWGNTFYVPNIPPNARDIVSVAAGSSFSVALRSDGTLVSWTSISGAPAPPTPLPGVRLTNIVAIAASWGSVAALRADGTALIWGGVSDLPSSFTNVTDLACLGFDSDVLALRRNGTMVEYSHFSVPTYPTNNITGIAVGSYNAFALVGSGPPVFPGLPVNRTVASGSRAYFRAVAVGAMPMSYQWNCNGTNVPGATNSVLVVTNVQPIQAGNYYTLTASNAFGLATNGTMILNEVPLEFTIQPQTLSTAVGATAIFAITNVIGQGPFTYQWQCSNTNISGATNTSLSLTNVQLNQAGTYSLVTGNGYGNVTNNAVLAVQQMMFNAGLTNLVMTTNGLKLELDSVYAANSVVIFASTDLVSWLPIFTNPPAAGSVLFLDSAATNAALRFYRAQEQ